MRKVFRNITTIKTHDDIKSQQKSMEHMKHEYITLFCSGGITAMSLHKSIVGSKHYPL